MGKKNKKGRKTALREKLKKSENPKKEVSVNPFELRINHERYNILGRKSKNDKGMPGVSRNKAIKKRKELMFRNKLLTSKSNCFIDKRIGEYDNSILKEDQIAARLVYEKRKKLKRNIYNLNDDEELTHLGQPLSMLDTLDNRVSDSDDDEDKLDSNFVEEAHFGGFLTKKTSEEPPKTHKEIINDLILESKKKKEGKKLEREKILDLTDKLDKEWKELMSNVGGLKHENKPPVAPKHDRYDMIYQELKFEPRGTPANKLKAPEEIEKEEREKLAKLEQERLLRMKDVAEDKKVSDQLSADSIYDGLELETDFSAPPDVASGDASQKAEESSELNDDEDEENNSHSDSESSQEEGDMYSDLNSESENEEMESEKEEIPESTVVGPSTESLPSKFECVRTLEEFLKLISAHCDIEVSVIIEKMIKCNHPSLGDGNRSKMTSLFKILLDYIDHICQKGSDSTEVINSLVPHLFSLAQMSPSSCSSTFRDALLKNYELLKKQRKGVAFKKYFPQIGSLIILKLCGILYSTSDFRHPVVIVAMLYMSEVLSHKFFITYKNLISRLFVTNLFYEYVALSKRFVPEAISLLQTILYCSSVKHPESLKFCGGAYHGDQDLLLVTSAEECEPQKISIKLFSSDTPIQSNGKLKISLLDNAVKQLHRYVDLYSSLPSFSELFSPIHSLINFLPMKYYPASLKDSIQRLDDTIVGMMACKRSYLVFPLKKPKPLKLFEPDFDFGFGGKKNSQSKKMKLAKELSKKCVREQKGVVREIRRDTQFLARQQLQEKMEKDEERRNKVKKLFQDLAVQQREIKAMNKRKK